MSVPAGGQETMPLQVDNEFLAQLPSLPLQGVMVGDKDAHRASGQYSDLSKKSWRHAVSAFTIISGVCCREISSAPFNIAST
jgi:hypothetical protein